MSTFDFAVFRAAQKEWLERWPQITGIGLGWNKDGTPAVRFFMASQLLDEMPKEHQGLPVTVYRYTGTIKRW